MELTHGKTREDCDCNIIKRLHGIKTWKKLEKIMIDYMQDSSIILRSKANC